MTTKLAPAPAGPDPLPPPTSCRKRWNIDWFLIALVGAVVLAIGISYYVFSQTFTPGEVLLERMEHNQAQYAAERKALYSSFPTGAKVITTNQVSGIIIGHPHSSKELGIADDGRLLTILTDGGISVTIPSALVTVVPTD